MASLDIEYEQFKEQDSDNGSFNVSFKIDGQILHAHRRKLASKSKVFKKMFRKNPRNSGPIEIKAASFEGFKEFLSYFYHLSFNFNPTLLFEVFELADEYQVKCLIELCDERIRDATMEVEVDFFKMHEALNIPGLSNFRNDLQSSFYSFGDQLLKDGDLMKASKKAILGILTFERNKGDNIESRLFETVVHWVKNQANIMQPNHQYEYIKAEMAALLPKFDFRKMSTYFLKPFTDAHRSIFPSPGYIKDILRQSDKSVYKAICGNYYTLSPPIRQTFPFLPSMMNYLTNHWSAEIYQKLSKTCKHFFYAHRIVVVKDMDSPWRKSPGWDFRYSDIDQDLLMYELSATNWFWIDLSIKKLWITGKERFICSYPFLYKYIYACELKEFEINSDGMLDGKSYSFDLFALTAPKLTKIDIHGHDIYLGSNTLTLGDILSYTPNLVILFVRGYDKIGMLMFHKPGKDFRQTLWNIRRSTSPDLPVLPKLEWVYFEEVLTFADPHIMLQFIKNHNAKFHFQFSNNQNGYDSFKAAVLEAYSDSTEKVLTEALHSWGRYSDFKSKISIEKSWRIIGQT